MCGLTFGEWQSIEGGRKAGALDVKIDKIARGLDYDRDWLMWGQPNLTATFDQKPSRSRRPQKDATFSLPKAS
jgi:hypothetical protein